MTNAAKWDKSCATCAMTTYVPPAAHTVCVPSVLATWKEIQTTLEYVAIADQTVKRGREMNTNEKEWISFAKEQAHIWNHPWRAEPENKWIYDTVLAMCIYAQPIMGGHSFTTYSWYKDGMYSTFKTSAYQTFGANLWSGKHLTRVMDKRTNRWYHIVAQPVIYKVLELCTCHEVTASVWAWIIVGQRMGMCCEMVMYIAKLVWNGRFIL